MKPWIMCAAAASLVAGAGAPSQARNWSKDPAALAQDYLVIQDRRGAGDVVIVFWLASPLVPASTPNVEAARDLLDKYTLVATAHMKMNPEQSLEPVTEAAPSASDAAGNALAAFDEASTPPVMVGALAMVKSIFARSLGPFGKGVQWTLFNRASSKACERGGLRVAYAGTVYSYDTPIPGCP